MNSVAGGTWQQEWYLPIVNSEDLFSASYQLISTHFNDGAVLLLCFTRYVCAQATEMKKKLNKPDGDVKTCQIVVLFLVETVPILAAVVVVVVVVVV